MVRLIKSINKVWQNMVDHYAGELIKTLRNPMSDLPKTIVIFGIVLAVIFLLLFIIITLISIYNRNRGGEIIVVEEGEDIHELADRYEAGEEEEEEPPVTMSRRYARITSWVLFVAIIGVLLGGVDWFTSQPALCANCHMMQNAYKSWEAATHKEVGCLGCHQDPGMTGFGVRRLMYVRETVSFFRNYSGKPRSEISNHACLKCHEDEMNKVLVAYNVRVRHKEFLGDSCSSCHSAVGHGDAAVVQTIPTMSKCLDCHNGDQASANCGICHAKDIGVEMRDPKGRGLPKMVRDLDNCRGCHSVVKCTSHHGTEMPHQSNWEKIHGKIAGASNDPVCWNCHNPDHYVFCKNCHRKNEPHGREWTKLHKFVVRGQRPYGLRQCSFCHTLTDCRTCHNDLGVAPIVPNLTELFNHKWPAPR